MASVPDDAFDLVGAEIMRETEAAVLVRSSKLPENERGYRELWVPKANLHDESEVYAVGDEGTCLVKLWWAEQRGLV